MMILYALLRLGLIYDDDWLDQVVVGVVTLDIHCKLM